MHMSTNTKRSTRRGNNSHTPAVAGISPAKPKTETITVKVKDENAMDVDKTQTTCPPPKCYNCGKIGHIVKHCQGKTAVQAMGVQEYFSLMTEEEKEEMRRQLGFVKN